MIFEKSGGAVDWLIVGLGNPGQKYEHTRHNMGFLTVDLLAEQLNVKLNKVKFKSAYNIVRFGGQKCLVMKPQTYMNLSGEAVREAAQFYKIPADHVLVIYDDVSLPVGKLRVRPTGSAGGHNGIKNIIAHLGTSIRMSKGNDSFYILSYKCLRAFFNCLSYVVYASDSRNDPDFIADSGTSVISSVSIEETGFFFSKWSCFFVICISKKISQPCF